PEEQEEEGHRILHKGFEVAQMMKVIGEEGTALNDFIEYLKAEFFDFVYLQQNAFDPVDEATSAERQKYIFEFIFRILKAQFTFKDKDEARHFFQSLRQEFKGWNSSPWKSAEFGKIEKDIVALLSSKIK
ncbi:MAG: V-type ATP synthase subunit A, partial [Candidatus Omnitrophota bacterium]